MKLKLTALAIAVALTGCASSGKKEEAADKIEPIRSQKLATSFKAEGITIESECGWFTSKKNCDITAIEAVGTAATNGNTENNVRVALIRAGDRARANVRHFINEDVSSSRVNRTIAKNIEQAMDKMKQRANNGDTVALSDEDVLKAKQEDAADKSTNFMERNNYNDTAHNLTDNIAVNAQGILRGFRVVKQEKIGPQEVAVTLRWDTESDAAASMMRKKFDGK
jgi:hypothetical protein